MEVPKQILQRWKASLPARLTIAGCLAKNPTAYKWKAPYRLLVLREVLFWRTYDLLVQAQLLHEQMHTLGSRLLLRSALETVAVLAYSNHRTRAFLDQSITFEEFEISTRLLLLGSRDNTTKYSSVNVLTILERVDRLHPGVLAVYNTLSESAHPNFEGVCFGYSEIDYERDETSFAVKIHDMWADRHDSLFAVIATVFEYEYDEVWAPQQEQLEAHLAAYDHGLKSDRGTDT
jgi:hypothetical protein